MKKVTLVLLVSVAGLLLVVGVGVGTAYMVMNKVAPTIAGAHLPAEELKEASGESAGAFKITLKPFVTNLGDHDRPRYINVSFQLFARAEKEKAEIEAREGMVRDAVISVLGSKLSKDLAGEDGITALKTDVQRKLNDVLGGRYVIRVLITDIVIQY
jgi:flagellar basal body-associated protein FliL